jgi:hypothetical protein
VSRTEDAIRGATAGAALAVALGYVHSGGYDRELVAEVFGGDEPWEPADVVVWVTIIGAAFGTGCVAATRILPLPRVLAGAAYGLAVWGAAEGWHRSMIDGSRRWGFRPPARTASVLALSGATVARLVGRH